MTAFCTQCGAGIPEGVRFCTECGTAAGAAQPAQPVYAPPTRQTHIPPAPAAPVTSGDAPPPPGSAYAVMSTGAFFGHTILFAIPVIGQIICLIMAFAARNRTKRSFARSTLLFMLIGLVLSIGLYVSGKWIIGRVSDTASESAGGGLFGLFGGAEDRADGGDTRGDAGDSGGSAENAIDRAITDAFASGAFTKEAATAALQLKGIDAAKIAPDWPHTVDEGSYANYGDQSHGSIHFIKKDGEVSDEDYHAWLKKVFDYTASISDDKHNIQGWSYGEGEAEKTWDEFITGEAWIQTWSYKYDGVIMDVTVERTEDPEQDSETIVEGNSRKIVYHYKGVGIDIATGLQKSWDETWSDLEKYFEENQDEIEKALQDALGG